MDKHHFGADRCHEILAEYLTELGNQRLCQRAHAMLQQYNLDRKEIAESNLSARMKPIALKMLQERYKRYSVEGTSLEDDPFVKSLLFNVLVTECRKELRKLRKT